MLFSIEDSIFTLTMFWTTSIYLGSFFWDSMDIILFWIWSYYILMIFKIFDHNYENGGYKEDI
jgi:hypothetical protein